MKLWSLLVLSAVACRPGALPRGSETSAAAEKQPAPPVPSARSVASPGGAPAGAELRFEPRPGPVIKGDTAPRLSFRSPSEGELVEESALATLAIEVDAELSRLGPSSAVAVSLDGVRPRRLAGGRLTISELSPPDKRLAAGEHFLVAAAVDGEGRLIRAGAGRALTTTVRFWLTSRDGPGTSPELVCWGPHGTYYGAAAEPAIDVLVAARSGGESVADLVATVEGAGVRRTGPIDASQPWAIVGLSSGDYRVLVQPSTAAAGKHPGECRFTLNRETERPAP